MITRVVKRMSLDIPPKPYWIIEEVVTPQGHYIELPGIYASEENARAEEEKTIEERAEQTLEEYRRNLKGY